jgi:hypothetical protein
VSAIEVPESLIAANPALGPWAVLVGYRGSVAHGTYVPNTDRRSGVVVRRVRRWLWCVLSVCRQQLEDLAGTGR